MFLNKVYSKQKLFSVINIPIMQLILINASITFTEIMLNRIYQNSGVYRGQTCNRNTEQ